jgi:sugar/nucleoside kinase (ribokinase family)
MTSYDISVIGALNIDLIVKGATPPDWQALSTWDNAAQIELMSAGSVGYTVQNLARLGLSVCLSSCVSDDPFGQFIEDTLLRAGIDTSLVQRVPGSSAGIAIYLLVFGSSKRPLFYRLPTHPLWQTEFSPEAVDHLLDARMLHCGGFLHMKAGWYGDMRDLYREAKARGLITSLDPQFPLETLPVPWISALSDILPHVDLLFCGEDEACGLTAASDLDIAARCLLDAGAATVVIKRGADGSIVYGAGWRYLETAATFGGVEDAIGAGDAYDAGFLYGMIQGWELEDCARCGSIAAGLSVTGMGGAAAFPDLPTLLAEMDKY